jgi:CYTH domain-containing protein
MATEIERKFLVKGDDWRTLTVREEYLRDGLIAINEHRKVRVRLYGDRATLAIKAKTTGLRDAEYEYDIPTADAEELLAQHCDENHLSKRRYFVPYRGFTWQIDVYEGIMGGIVLAEVEMEKEDADIPLPRWVGEEVTGNPDYKKHNLFTARLAERKRKKAPCPD